MRKRRRYITAKNLWSGRETIAISCGGKQSWRKVPNTNAVKSAPNTANLTTYLPGKMFFRNLLGAEWRHKRDGCSNYQEWMHGATDFVRETSQLYQIACPPFTRPKGDAFEMPGSIGLSDLHKYPPLPAHPNDSLWDSHERRLWIQVDCRGVADVVNGEALLKSGHCEMIFRRIGTKLVSLSCRGCLPRRDIDSLVNWSPRKCNTVPDHMANAAMHCRTD